MERKATPQKQLTEAERREARLKAALKANLGRRKAQARVRAQSGQDEKGGETPQQDKKE